MAFHLPTPILRKFATALVLAFCAIAAVHLPLQAGDCRDRRLVASSIAIAGSRGWGFEAKGPDSSILEVTKSGTSLPADARYWLSGGLDLKWLHDEGFDQIRFVSDYKKCTYSIVLASGGNIPKYKAVLVGCE